jgi:hypothetical protein
MQNTVLFITTNSTSLAEATYSQAVKVLMLQHQNFSMRLGFQILILEAKRTGM